MSKSNGLIDFSVSYLFTVVNWENGGIFPKDLKFAMVYHSTIGKTLTLVFQTEIFRNSSNCSLLPIISNLLTVASQNIIAQVRYKP